MINHQNIVLQADFVFLWSFFKHRAELLNVAQGNFLNKFYVSCKVDSTTLSFKEMHNASGVFPLP